MMERELSLELPSPPMAIGLNVADVNRKMPFEVARAHQRRREFEAARRIYAQVGEQEPFSFEAATQELVCSIEVCDWRRYDHLQRVVHGAARFGAGWVLGETTLSSPYFSAADQRACAERHARHILTQTGQADFSASEVFVRCAPSEKRLRIGFLGEDFYGQATSYLMTAVIEAHDRARFEYVAYDMHPSPPNDDARARAMHAFDRFETAGGMDSRELAARIEWEEFDILVYIQAPSHRGVEVLARRPAPVQIAWLYYPGPIGAPLVDALVADEIVIPRELEHHYPCHVLRLPGCYQPNDHLRRIPGNASRADFGIPADAFVLANFSQSYKLTPQVFDVWCSLLRRYPQCVLWLLGAHDEVPVNLRREARIRGVDPARLHFAKPMASGIHLTRLALCDVVLDTWPYGGHTLTSDALWAGTPVVTCAGETFASRVAASLLHDVGLPDLVAYDAAGYEACAAGLIEAPTRARQLGTWLAASRDRHALFDSTAYARKLEALWMQVAEGAIPNTFANIAT
jgi:predicted O-linked N-acetylglucosamine transferase (SPINDLY family)